MQAVLGYSREEWEVLVRELGQPAYRARQIMEWVYRRAVGGFGEITVLPQALRDKLAARADLGRRSPEAVRVSSRDGTGKMLFRYAGDRCVETVFIPEGRRGTLCLSTQAGCARGCTFCATGRLGLRGSLSAAEILNQYLAFPERERVTHWVFMGMGEPFDNTDAVLRSLDRLTDPEACGVSPARITVSTVGILPGLVRFVRTSQAHLAISLHNPFPEERRERMPVEDVFPLQKVIDLLRADWPRRGRRRLTMEITLQAGWNDTRKHARGLAQLLQGLPARINLIPLNPLPGREDLRPSDPGTAARFQAELLRHGFRVTQRRSRGQDIGAACGLLDGLEARKAPR